MNHVHIRNQLAALPKSHQDQKAKLAEQQAGQRANLEKAQAEAAAKLVEQQAATLAKTKEDYAAAVAQAAATYKDGVANATGHPSITPPFDTPVRVMQAKYNTRPGNALAKLAELHDSLTEVERKQHGVVDGHTALDATLRNGLEEATKPPAAEAAPPAEKAVAP
jgi:multidrug efflux pump subunit AcrA (membrane-fusion protein)